MMLRFFTIAAVILSLLSCKNSTMNHSQAIPAVLTNASPLVLDEIEEAITLRLNGVTPFLSQNLFEQSSWLIIERKPPRNINNQYPLGRSQEVPIRFQLVKVGEKCLLRQDLVEGLIDLKMVKCRLITDLQAS